MRWRRGEPCYRDPELLAKAFENDSVAKALWLFDKLPMLSPLAKTAAEWGEILRDELGELARSVLNDSGKHPLNLGHVLRNAAQRHPERVTKDTTEGHGGVSKWSVSRRDVA